MDHQTKIELNGMLEAVSDLVDIDIRGGGQFSTELPIDMGAESVQRIGYLAQCLTSSVKEKYPQFSVTVTVDSSETSLTVMVSRF